MTPEQPRSTVSAAEKPRTEAGRAILDVIGEALGYPIDDTPAWTSRVAAIEAEASALLCSWTHVGEAAESRPSVTEPDYWFAQGTLIHAPDRGGIDVGPLIGEARTEASAASLVRRHNDLVRAASPAGPEARTPLYPDGCETDTEHYLHKQAGRPR